MVNLIPKRRVSLLHSLPLNLSDIFIGYSKTSFKAVDCISSVLAHRADEALQGRNHLLSSAGTLD